MTAPPSPRTWAAGEILTALLLNAEIRDTAAFLLNPPHVSASQTSPTNFATSGTAAVVSWDTEAYKTDAMHSTSSNPSRFIANTSGVYSVSVNLAFVSNTTGIRTADLRKNAAGASGGGTRMGFWSALAVTGSTVTTVGGSVDVPMAAGDYLEVFGVQTSGGALALTAGLSFLTMCWKSA